VGQYGLATRSGHIIGVRAWLGALPPGSEAVFGIKPSLFQYWGGAELGGAFAVSPATKAIFSAIGQYSGAEVQGKFISSEKSDKFTTTTTLIGFGAGAQHVPKKDIIAYFELRLFKKNTSTSLNIGDDSTQIKLTDDLSRDAVFGFPLLLSAGAQYLEYSLTLSELYVPSRISMPSVTLGWNFYFDQNRKSDTFAKDIKETKDSTPAEGSASGQVPSEGKATPTETGTPADSVHKGNELGSKELDAPSEESHSAVKPVPAGSKPDTGVAKPKPKRLEKPKKGPAKKGGQK
jgi:hypothetical protein